jgi:transposase
MRQNGSERRPGMEAYSLDLRERVVKVVEEGRLTREEIAKLFQVSTAWIRRLLQRRRETGSLAPLPRRSGRHPKLDEVHQQRLLEEVRKDADATLAELRHRVRVKVSVSTIWRTLASMKVTRKKSVSVPKSRIDRTS